MITPSKVHFNWHAGFVSNTVRDARGNRSEAAARALPIDRTTLYRLMRRLSL